MSGSRWRVQAGHARHAPNAKRNVQIPQRAQAMPCLHPTCQSHMEENMRASTAYKMSRSVPAAMIASWIAVGLPASACANVITDWDKKAVAVVSPIVPAGVTQSV